MTLAWDPEQYDRYAGERDRPARELLARVPQALEAREIWDLGCGPGRQAAWLKQRWPEARVHGLDSDAAMLEAARALDPEIDWRQGDIDGWAPERAADLIYANASLQWLPDHAALFPRLVERLAPGGVLAVQMPMAAETRHHAILRETAAEGPWADRLAGTRRISPLLAPETYYDLLSAGCGAIDIWSTTYLQALEGEEAVLEWMKGTAMRPMLAALADAPGLRAGFLSALGARLGEAFPRRGDDRTLMPFPRLFLVAVRR